ncbi:MAG: GTPase ObgE [Verrucomicrobiota bacterium]
MFVDHIRVHAKAGRGGSGSASFRREKFEPKGGPDGGDGGDGGSVILESDEQIDSLRDFFYKPGLKAKAGGDGQGRGKTGRSGDDLVLRVPSGTMVYRVPEEMGVGRGAPAREDLKALDLVADLTRGGERFVLAKGGKGGRGNLRFKSSTNRAPTEAEAGGEGEEGDFYLELRRIADAGLVGFPNAGKSTLLGRLSAAKPKVAAYPFTTLQPMVGVLEFEGFSRGTVADIPGLIEGAHRNVGLGHDFLRHIMRCRLLIFVVDIAGTDGREPIEDVMKLREEISLYDEALAQKPWLIVANKMDLAAAQENWEAFRGRFPKVEIIPISAEGGTGVDQLKEKLQDMIGERPD